MKIFVILMLSLNITMAADLEWGDLDLYREYTLNQTIDFPGILTIPAGEKFEMYDRFGGEASLIYLQVHRLNCIDPDKTAEMVLVNPSPNDLPRDRSVGVALDTGCNLDIWVEAKDYYSKSIFSE